MNDKIEELKKVFADCISAEARYQKIIELGRKSQPLPREHKIPENLVPGCQSQMYLYTHLEEDRLHFDTEADALISNGLGVLLTFVYSGETPETVLKEPPSYLEELGIPASLSPNRANGLASLHLRMKQEALKALTATADLR